MDAEYKIAWAAGFLDGEGCFSLTKKAAQSDEYRAPAVSCNQIRRENLELLAELFGGEVRPLRFNDAGQQIWQWSIVSGPAIVVAIEKLLPHLRGKREEAAALLAWCRTVKRRGRAGVPPLVRVRRRQIVAAHLRARQEC